MCPSSGPRRRRRRCRFADQGGHQALRAGRPRPRTSLVKPANTSGKDGTTVVIGKTNTKKTLEMYEDLRCPVCWQFEQIVGPRSARTSTPASTRSIHRRHVHRQPQPGTGSKTALSALGAALNVTPTRSSTTNRAVLGGVPPGRDRRQLQDRDYLIQIVRHRPRAQGNATFQRPCRTAPTTSGRWPCRDKFNSEQASRARPTLKMDGKKITTARRTTPDDAARQLGHRRGPQELTG